MKRYRLQVVTTAIFLCLISGLSFAQDATVEPTLPELTSDTPLYAVRGPYSVGRTWFSVNNGNEPPLILVAWYPAVAGDQEGTLTVPDEYNFPNVQVMEATGNWGSATLNAAPDSSNAPHPLVIYSTGYGTTPRDYVNLEEHLASYGFVVVTAVSLLLDQALWSSFMVRPLVVPHEIDFAEKLNSQDGSFKEFIDVQHIGVVGYSSGGYTALAAGGARLDLAWFETWCGDNEATVAADHDCPPLLGHKEEMLALTNLDSMPTSLWPSWGDPRVSAIVSQSAPAFLFGSSGLSSVTVPIMVQFGSNDRIATPEWAGSLTYDSVSSIQKALVEFENGNHVIFAEGGGDVEPDGWDMDRAHDLINHFTTAFLFDILKNDPEAHSVLLPDAVSFPSITYTTTMQ